MKIRIEAEETGELFTELDMSEIDMDKLLAYAITRLQSEGKEVKLPLGEDDIVRLTEYAFKSIFEDEAKKVGLQK
jgi:hypothetical protein